MDVTQNHMSAPRPAPPGARHCGAVYKEILHKIIYLSNKSARPRLGLPPPPVPHLPLTARGALARAQEFATLLGASGGAAAARRGLGARAPHLRRPPARRHGACPPHAPPRAARQARQGIARFTRRVHLVRGEGRDLSG